MTARRDRERGFTLVELLVAIAILGIIMVAIGAMIATAFRTTATVSDRLTASRGPKMVSRYWLPDVESAETIASGAGCAPASGSQPVATFTWPEDPSTVDTPDADPNVVAPVRTVTWSYHPGTRNQLVRTSCLDGALTRSLVVVADVSEVPTVESVTPTRHVLSVTVPDHSEKDKTLTFTVGARQAVTP